MDESNRRTASPEPTQLTENCNEHKSNNIQLTIHTLFVHSMRIYFQRFHEMSKIDFFFDD